MVVSETFCEAHVKKRWDDGRSMKNNSDQGDKVLD
jgi:hypothetical protein